MQSNPFFMEQRQLAGNEAYRSILRSLEGSTAQPGSSVINYQDTGDLYYIVLQGKV